MVSTTEFFVVFKPGTEVSTMHSIMLTAGPVFFYDQQRTKASKRVKKMPEELPADVKFLNINPRLAGFMNSLSKRRKSIGAGPTGDKGEMTLTREDGVRREKYPVLPEILNSTTSRHNAEDVHAKAATSAPVFPTDDDLQMNPFDEYKYAAPSILYELGKMLLLFARYELIFPQGLVNVLNYSWKDLTEGAVYTKRQWQSLAYQGVKPSMVQLLEESEGKQAEEPASENTEHVKNKNRKTAMPSEPAKDAAPSKPVGSKTAVAQANVSYLPVTISFSMASRVCEQRGWISREYAAESEDRGWRALYSWAVERLQLAQIPINKQLSKLKEDGFDKPVVLRHYDETRKEAFIKFKKATKNSHSSVLLDGKPQIPQVKQANPALKKLHYSLIDGSSLTYYPSGRLAICQSYSGLACGGVYTNVYGNSSEQAILGTFTPFGLGSICIPNSSTIALMFNQDGGMVTDKDGEIVREWTWPRIGKLSVPVVMQVNEYITLRIAAQFSVSLLFKWQQDSVRLSISPLSGATPPKVEELGLLVTNENFTSKAAKELSKPNRKKAKEKDKKMSKKTLFLSELVKTLEIPEADISHVSDFNAAKELRKLQRKIRNILDDWMEGYRIATGIDSPHIQRMSSGPQKPLRSRKVRSAAPPATNMAGQESQKAKEKTEGLDLGSDAYSLLARWQSAPVRSTQWEMLRSASPRPPSLQNSSRKPYQPNSESNLNKSDPNRSATAAAVPGLVLHHDAHTFWPSSHDTCPAVLRRAALGEEGRQCRCSNHQIPHVTDLEYDRLIANHLSALEQIIVVSIVASSDAKDRREDVMLEQLYEKKNQYRCMPCMQSRLDSFRLLKYNIDSADEFTGRGGCLLVERHIVAPGMFLMYLRGKLMFANYIFNGYSKSIKDLHKQIAKTRSDYHTGFCLPKDFKFSPEYSLQSTPTSESIVSQMEERVTEDERTAEAAER
ncbi:uncharacterized protein [Ambystoma mexicanum]|uniref:uncharacterized protein isoform X2 n=1 Tax=Ambystoma mexicanum TaxID=8296 RepID=UPI0037E8D2A6